MGYISLTKIKVVFISMIFIDRGSVIGASWEQVNSCNNLYHLMLLSTLNELLLDFRQENKNYFSLNNRQLGVMKQNHNALYNDIHGLATQLELINELFVSRDSFGKCGVDMYVSEVTEGYFAKLRSCYDFVANLLPLIIGTKFIDDKIFKTFNNLLTHVEKRNENSPITDELSSIIISVKDSFLGIKNVRDSIIHHGKTINIFTYDDGFYFSLSNKIGGSELLLPYLSRVTYQLILLTEYIGGLFYLKYKELSGRDKITLNPLTGLCIPFFKEMMQYAKEEIKTSTL